MAGDICAVTGLTGTRAGMGRCQGGFCMPRVAAILAEELDCSLLDITKDGGESNILLGTVASFLERGNTL